MLQNKERVDEVQKDVKGAEGSEDILINMAWIYADSILGRLQQKLDLRNTHRWKNGYE